MEMSRLHAIHARIEPHASISGLVRLGRRRGRAWGRIAWRCRRARTRAGSFGGRAACGIWRRPCGGRVWPNPCRRPPARSWWSRRCGWWRGSGGGGLWSALSRRIRARSATLWALHSMLLVRNSISRSSPSTSTKAMIPVNFEVWRQGAPTFLIRLYRLAVFFAVPYECWPPWSPATAGSSLIS
jgi:hypothetical protein